MDHQKFHIKYRWNWSALGFNIIDKHLGMYVYWESKYTWYCVFHPYQARIKSRKWLVLLKEASKFVKLSLEISPDYINVCMLKDIFEEHNLGLDISLFVDWLPYATKECYDKDLKEWINLYHKNYNGETLVDF